MSVRGTSTRHDYAAVDDADDGEGFASAEAILRAYYRPPLRAASLEPGGDRATAESIDRRQRRAALVALCVAAVEDADVRDALTAHYGRGMPLSTLADRIGRSDRTVDRLMGRGKAQIAAKARELGIWRGRP